jgi:phosphatidylinositol alpha-mannosyltransferase
VEIPSLNPEVQLVLAGGGSAADAYVRSLRKHASDKIRFFDYVSGEQFEELLTNAMLFVLPFDLEGLSLALLEAMGAGLCVLASDIPENRELVDGAGFLFQAGNAVDLERMLRFLTSDSAARAWAGERAKHRIQQHYLWPEITAQVEAVYLDVLGWGKKDVVDSSVPSLTLPPTKPVASERAAESLPRITRAG